MPSFNSWFLRQWFGEVIKMMEEKQNGKHRRTSTKAHGNPSDRTNNGPGTVPTFRPFPPARYTFGSFLSPGRPDAKPRSGPYAGIRTGEVIAWRCWWVYMKNLCNPVPQLCSIAHQHLWEPGAVETGNVDAWITMAFDEVAGGVYAWSDFAGCYTRVCQMCESRNTIFLHRFSPPIPRFDFNPYRDAVGVAWGTVKLWGEVIEHQVGWRASHAKVHTINGAVGDGFCVEELRAIYGVGEDATYLGAPWHVNS